MCILFQKRIFSPSKYALYTYVDSGGKLKTNKKSKYHHVSICYIHVISTTHN